jgi:TonB family protein
VASGGWIRAARAAAVVALLSGVVAARTACAQSAAEGATAFAAWNAQLIPHLKLTSEQQAALLDYEATIGGPPAEQVTLDSDQFRAMTLPQRLDFLADHIATDAAKARSRADAAHKFYAALTPDQRLQFDTATLPPQGHPGVAADATPLSAPVDENYSLPSHTNPDWMVRPSPDDMSRVYPSDAMQHHVTGNAVLVCVVDENGYLTECVVESETPKDAGFGNAALEITAYMRMKPATNYGVPVRSRVTVPIKFQFPTPPPAE